MSSVLESLLLWFFIQFSSFSHIFLIAHIWPLLQITAHIHQYTHWHTHTITESLHILLSIPWRFCMLPQQNKFVTLFVCFFWSYIYIWRDVVVVVLHIYLFNNLIHVSFCLVCHTTVQRGLRPEQLNARMLS